MIVLDTAQVVAAQYVTRSGAVAPFPGQRADPDSPRGMASRESTRWL